jgi:hypothetical protein
MSWPSTDAMVDMTYRFPVTVTDIFDREAKRHISGAGNSAVFETYSAGWYVQLDHLTSIYIGAEKPDLQVGEKLIMKLERSR